MKILGKACDSTSEDDGIHYSWKEGPVLVLIEPAFDEAKRRKDWCVSIFFFRGDKDTDSHEPTLQVWRAKQELAAAYAERRLKTLLRALGDVP